MVRGRTIRASDLQQIREFIAAEGERGRTHVSRRLCELWNWRQANGHYRQIACRDLLRRLEAKGLLELPPPKKAARQPGYRNRTELPEDWTAPTVAGLLGSFVERIEVRRVVERAEARLYAGLMGRYHYLGYRQATGAQLKYLVWLGDQPLGGLSFGPAAWKVAVRDAYLGWPACLREQRLGWIVNHERFLLLPGVRIPLLASQVLAVTTGRLRRDWQEVYGQDLALAETFVEAARFTGRCYAAANWTCLGETAGRGRNDRYAKAALPVKTVWVRALRADFRCVLTREEETAA